MTPTQQRVICDLIGLITRQRQGGQNDAFIRAGLIAEGWAIAAVNAAFETIKGQDV